MKLSASAGYLLFANTYSCFYCLQLHVLGTSFAQFGRHKKRADRMKLGKRWTMGVPGHSANWESPKPEAGILTGRLG
jgi:hypothetical protein